MVISWLATRVLPYLSGMKRIRTLSFLLLLIPTISACSLVRGSPSPAPNPGASEAGVPAVGRGTGGVAGRFGGEIGTGEVAGSFGGEIGSREAARVTSGVVETALKAIGTPYVWGGSGQNGFDCSGLIQYSYGEFGVRLHRLSSDQLRTGLEIEPTPSALRPGDILGFSGDPGGKTSHVGLYIGDGDFIHSSSAGVAVSNLTNRYWREHFIEARRVVW